MSVDEQNLNETESLDAAQPEQAVDASAENMADATSAEGKNWQAEAESLAAQVSELKEQALRAQAETQNIRRRAEQDVEKAHKFALEKFAKELLPVIDSLEKSMENLGDVSANADALKEGIEMTLSMFVSGMNKFNLQAVDPMGQSFDPALHEAMSIVDAPGAEPNSVIAVIQKGYTLNGRLVRPAMVMVAKNAPTVNEQA